MRRVTAAVLASAVMLLGAACSPNPYPGETGKILHVSLRLHPKSFDPPSIEEEGSGKCAAHVYDGLLMYHPFARPYKLIPALAKSMPEVSADQLTYTFELKRGLKFCDDPCFTATDGKSREVTAEDFVWCFKRFGHPRTQAKGWWLFDGKILGFNEWREARKNDVRALFAAHQPIDPLVGIEKPVAGITALGRYKLRLRLTKPYPQLLWVLAMPYASVYPHEAIAYYKDEYRNHPVGTGPFRVKRFNPVYRVVHERNANFRDEWFPDPRNKPEDRIEGWDWQADEKRGLLKNAGKKLPLLDGMEIRFILEDQPRWLYFNAGYSDFLNPPKDNTEEAIVGGELSDEMKARGVRVDPWPELGTVYAALRTDDPVLSNVQLRRAMALAYDHAWTVKHLYGGQAIVATSLIPPGVAGYDPDYHPYHRSDGKAQLDKAREYMIKAGYPGGINPKTGKRLRLTFDNSGAGATQKQFAERFKHEMRQIGIDVVELVNTFPQLVEKMRTRNYQVTSLAWGFDYPDAQNILQLLYGPNEAPGINRTNFKNAEFDRLYEKASVLEDGPERTKLYVRMAHIVGDEVPWITRTHRIRQNLQHAWLSGFRYTETSYQYWRYADVDVQLRNASVEEWNKPTWWPVWVLALSFVALVGSAVLGGGRRI